MLRDRGFRAVALKGGFQAWKQAGFAVEAKDLEQVTMVGQVCNECGRPVSDHLA